MMRIIIAIVLFAGIPLAAQQTQPVFEITGEVRDVSGRRVPAPVEVSVIPCGPGIFDSTGRFRADCSKSSVHAGQPIVIMAEKDGWGPVAIRTAAPEGGALAMPIQMALIPKTPVSVTKPGLPPKIRPQVTATFDVSNNGLETTLTVVVRNLTGKPILLGDLVVYVDDVYEIRHAIQKLSPQQVTALSESDLPLLGKASTSYTHIALAVASPAESQPLRFHLVDNSKDAERDHIYRARIEVTWNPEGGQPNAPAATEIPLLFLIEGRRFALDPKTTTQQDTNAAVEWNRRELDRMELAKAPRTPAVESLVANIKRFQPGEIKPGLTLREAATANISSVQALLLAGANRGKPHDLKADVIYNAAKAGNWELVTWLIDEGADFGGVIEFAAKARRADVVAYLISKGASPNPALKAAAQAGYLDIVRLAFDKGAEPQSVDLCAAVAGRNLDVLKLFLSKGVKTSSDACRDSYFSSSFRATESAMALAARTLQEDMLRALLESTGGPESDRRKMLGSLVADAILDGRGPGMPSSLKFKELRPVIALLLRLGADVRDIGGGLIASDADIARMLVEAGAQINSIGGNPAFNNNSQRGIFPLQGEYFTDQSALLYAVAQGCDLKLVKTLRELGARKVPFRLLYNGKDAVAAALEDYLPAGTPEAFERVECYFLAGAAVPAGDLVVSDGPAGQPGFRWPWVVAAAAFGDARVMQLLLDNGADPNATGSGGLTPLLALFKRKPSVEAVKSLLEKGADPNKKDAAGHSPIVAALQVTLVVPMDIVRLLEDSKAKYDVTSFSYDDYSPLTKCAYFGDLPCVEYLLSKGEDPKKRDKGKRTPTAAASKPEVEKILREALKRGNR